MQPSKGLHNQVVKIVVPYCAVHNGCNSEREEKKRCFIMRAIMTRGMFPHLGHFLLFEFIALL